MNIGSGCKYPANALSNFSPHSFVFDGVECASMEGLLQSFKFDKPHIQVEVCKLVGRAAKFRGQKRNKAWKKLQLLWWQEYGFRRDSPTYQVLLDRAYKAMFDQSDSFRRALKASGKAVLTHSLGSNKEEETVLTEQEFCSRLMKLRNLL
jgi:hypothetical protein